MQTFNIRDLRQKTGELVRQAESGDLSLVTKYGKPIFVALPLSQLLLESGVHLAFAVKLYEEGVVSLSKAARLADMPIEAFLGQLEAAGVDAVSYSAEDLEQEVEHLDSDSGQ